MFPCQTKTSLQFFLLNTDPRDAACQDELVVVFKKKKTGAKAKKNGTTIEGFYNDHMDSAQINTVCNNFWQGPKY